MCRCRMHVHARKSKGIKKEASFVDLIAAYSRVSFAYIVRGGGGGGGDFLAPQVVLASVSLSPSLVCRRRRKRGGGDRKEEEEEVTSGFFSIFALSSSTSLATFTAGRDPPLLSPAILLLGIVPPPLLESPLLSVRFGFFMSFILKERNGACGVQNRVCCMPSVVTPSHYKGRYVITGLRPSLMM